MQAMLLEVLQQRAAGGMDDALGDAGGAGGKQDVERVRKRQRLEGNRLRRVSGMFGIIAAMRSPFVTPWARKACCRRETSACSSSQLIAARVLSSARNSIAGSSPVRLSRFSAKFSSASGKNRAPGMASPFSRMRSPLVPRTPQKSHSADQNPSRSATDHACSASGSSSERPARAPAKSANAIQGLCFKSCSLGLHSGVSVMMCSCQIMRVRV
jgi:hypothetical protein